MKSMNYESHIHNDPSFPIIFHLNKLKRSIRSDWTHWHENIEILNIIEGSALVLSDANHISVQEGDIVVINSNNLHHVQSLSEESSYYCLIVDKQFCNQFGLFVEDIYFQTRIRDTKVERKFTKIYNELFAKEELYKSATLAAITDFLVYLYRNYTLSETSLSNKVANIRLETVKQAIKYIQANYNKDISTDEIAQKVGISKYYFCRTFKEVTGYTSVLYINLIRCSNAKKLLQSGKYTVSEAAFLSGFENLSYFTKTYKKNIGCLPSHSMTQGVYHETGFNQ